MSIERTIKSMPMEFRPGIARENGRQANLGEDDVFRSALDIGKPDLHDHKHCFVDWNAPYGEHSEVMPDMQDDTASMDEAMSDLAFDENEPGIHDLYIITTASASQTLEPDNGEQAGQEIEEQATNEQAIGERATGEEVTIEEAAEVQVTGTHPVGAYAALPGVPAVDRKNGNAISEIAIGSRRPAEAILNTLGNQLPARGLAVAQEQLSNSNFPGPETGNARANGAPVTELRMTGINAQRVPFSDARARFDNALSSMGLEGRLGGKNKADMQPIEKTVANNVLSGQFATLSRIPQTSDVTTATPANVATRVQESVVALLRETEGRSTVPQQLDFKLTPRSLGDITVKITKATNQSVNVDIQVTNKQAILAMREVESEIATKLKSYGVSSDAVIVRVDEGRDDQTSQFASGLRGENQGEYNSQAMNHADGRQHSRGNTKGGPDAPNTPDYNSRSSDGTTGLIAEKIGNNRAVYL